MGLGTLKHGAVLDLLQQQVPQQLGHLPLTALATGRKLFCKVELSRMKSALEQHLQSEFPDEQKKVRLHRLPGCVEWAVLILAHGHEFVGIARHSEPDTQGE